MNLVIFGLSLSSSWGNGHATLLRGLIRALAARGHRVTFFERDVPYYASHRDLAAPRDCELCLYGEWVDIHSVARQRLVDADVAMVTSYCPDAVAATELVFESRVPIRTFYDLDAPVTLDRLAAGESVFYIGPRKLAEFDLVFSYTGGIALERLRADLGARRVVPLYGSVDPDIHTPVRTVRREADLSYLGTYAADRQDALDALFFEPARRNPERTFFLGGSLYPDDLAWPPNVRHARHVAPPEHSAFYCSAAMTLNITRKSMASMGYCPSGRLFEAAACGVAVISDAWEGLDTFFEPGKEIFIARSTEDMLEALRRPASHLGDVARAARARVLAQHTAAHRADELVSAIETLS